MSSKDVSEENWEVIKSTQQDQGKLISRPQTKTEDWEKLQAEEVAPKGESVYTDTVKEEWQLVGQESSVDQQKEQQASSTSPYTPQPLQAVAKDISESVHSISFQIQTAVNYVTKLPSRILKLVKGSKSSEVGVVVLGVVAGGLLVSLLALSNRTYFWKSKAQRVYGDMIKLMKKTEDVNAVLSLSRSPLLSKTVSATTEFA